MQSTVTYIGPYGDIVHAHRPLSRRIPMPVSHRAKQFVPFAALKGYVFKIVLRQVTCLERIKK